MAMIGFEKYGQEVFHNCPHEDEDTVIEFLKELPSIALTFYSVGNHEW